MRFSYRMVPEVYQVFWAGMAAGEFINDAAVAAGRAPTRPLVAVASCPRRLVVTGARSRSNWLMRDHRRTIRPRAPSSPPDRCAH
jgi:hypothetical protein